MPTRRGWLLFWLFVGVTSTFLYSFSLDEIKFHLKFNKLTSNNDTIKPVRTSWDGIITDAVPHFWKTSAADNGHVHDWIDQWQCAPTKLCIYSAYWDDRPGAEPCVRIVGVAPKRRKLPVKCFVRVRDEHFKGNFSFLILPDYHGLPSVPVLFFCHWNGTPPSHVGIQPNLDGIDDIFWFPVRPMNPATNKQIAVCVRPFFGNISAVDLAPFIAFYTVLGVRHFTFYDYQTNTDVKDFLKTLMSSTGYSIELLPWNAPMAVLASHELAQDSFMHDCIYRNGRKFEFVLVIDIDEYIVPSHNRTLPQLIELVEKDFFAENNTNRIGSFTFDHAFFCTENHTDIPNSSLPMFDRVYHTDFLTRCHRTKFMVRSDAFEEAEIHCVRRQRQEFEDVTVNHSLAYLHHRCSIGEKTPHLDTRILQYKDMVLKSDVIDV